MLWKFHFVLVEEIHFCPMDSETNNFYAQCTDCEWGQAVQLWQVEQPTREQ